MRIVLTIALLLAVGAGLYLPLRAIWVAQSASASANQSEPQKITLPATARSSAQHAGAAPTIPSTTAAPSTSASAPSMTMQIPAESAASVNLDAVANSGVAAPDGRVEQTKRTAVHWAGARENAAAEQRLAAAEAALRTDASNVGALRDAATALRDLERWDQAAVMLRRLLEFENVTAVRFELAMSLVRQRLWTEAIPLLRDVVADGGATDASDPAAEVRRLTAAYNLALSLQAARRINESRHAWDDVIELWPDNEDARARRGEVLLDLHEWSAAAADFAAAGAAQPNDVGIVLNLALARYQAGDAAGANDALLAFVERNPTNVPAMNRLAELHWTLYRIDPASRDADRRAAQQWCERSLAIDERQPLIQALLRRVISGVTSDSE